MRSLTSQRGTVLIVALIFAAILAISITSFLKLAGNASKLANRSFYLDGAQNLVDTGLEQALWSLNNSTFTSAAGFSGRSGYANQYQGTFSSFNFSGNVAGNVKVWVDNSTSVPHAVSQATITLGDGSTFVKMAEAYMMKRSYFANGLVAKNTLTFVGNVAIDSWNSHADTATTADDVAYSAGVAHDSGKIASLRTTTASISVGNADVYGYAAVGGTSVADISVGSTGRIGAYGTANGVIDTSRVTYDFTTNFPDVSTPAGGALDHSYTIATINGPTTLPVVGNLPNTSDGKYYYYVPNIDIAGNDAIAITPGTNVVLVVTNATGTTVKAAGNSEIDIPPTATLKMFVSGDVSMTGNGVVNGTATIPNSTTSFQLYGTRTATDVATSGAQSFAIKGNGYLAGIVYAPNANVSVGGNGDTYGAVVSSQVSMNGNGNFHYDESLANIASTDLWSVSKWREASTTSTDRASYSTQLNF